MPHPEPLQPHRCPRELRPRWGVAAVVAPFGTGRAYAAEFRRRGWHSVAVTPPRVCLPAVYRVHEGEFLRVIEHDGDLARTAAELSRWDVAAVVAGSDLGVRLADSLAVTLGVPGNPVATTAARCDRAAMARAFAAAGLPAVRTLRTASLGEAAAWAYDIGHRTCTVQYPEAVPGGEVRLCASREQLVRAWRDLRRARGADRAHGNPLLVREETAGLRYAVNSVSYAGHHRVTEIWAEQRVRRGGVLLEDRADLLPPATAAAGPLADHTARALTALGVAYGPAHSKLLLTDRGPVPVETWARPDGGVDPIALVWATGSHHARDAVAALLDPLSLMDRRERAARHACRLVLAADRDGVLDTAALARILSLPTLAGTVGRLAPGARVRRTRDPLTSPGALMLVSDDQAEIERDVAAVRAMERGGLYRWQPYP